MHGVGLVDCSILALIDMGAINEAFHYNPKPAPLLCVT